VPSKLRKADPALPIRKLDPECTRQDILEVAREEFAENGLSGARVDAIAARTRTTKRMIYYYFGSKEGLYLAVLERAYAQIRAAEQTVDVEHLDPIAAIRRLAELTFDHHESHPDFIRLVSIENIHHAEHIVKSAVLASLNTRAVDVIVRILELGRAQGVFQRDDVDALDVHMLISAYCLFRVANQYTFGAIFGQEHHWRSAAAWVALGLGLVAAAAATVAIKLVAALTPIPSVYSTYLEVVAAVAGRERSGSLSAAEAAAILTAFRHDFRDEYRIIEITPASSTCRVINRSRLAAQSPPARLVHQTEPEAAADPRRAADAPQ